MQNMDVYNTLDDLKDELSAMGYEAFAMARDAESEMGAHPLPIEQAKMDALDSMSERLIAAAELIQEVNNILAKEDMPSYPYEIAEGLVGNE